MTLLREIYLHNLIRKATWDASADDVKAARSITGEMPSDIQILKTIGCIGTTDSWGRSSLPMDGKYQSIIFCSSLHDMPDPLVAIQKARDSLCLGGTLVIVHPQGASHVLNQVRNNPTMVPRGLPTSTELQTLSGWKIIHSPAASTSQEEMIDGYLAVLERIA